MDSNVTFPISAIIPTKDREEILIQTLESLAKQSLLPEEIIIIDGSSTILALEKVTSKLRPRIKIVKADRLGAGYQRNQGIDLSKNDNILFLDDDIELQADCLKKMWDCLEMNPLAGGVNAMIINQKYEKPGKISSAMYHFMHGKKLNSYAGKCIGPAWNLLPEDNSSLSEQVQVEWLNTTCTLYRKKALPSPVFDEFFTGYSLMEDLALSLRVSEKWDLMNARTARIFHNSQQGSHKSNQFRLSEMDVVNRFYVMTKILHRTRFSDYLKFCVFQLFQLVAAMSTLRNSKKIAPIFMGKASGFFKIIKKA